MTNFDGRWAIFFDSNRLSMTFSKYTSSLKSPETSSINETYSKASRSYQSTLAVFNLTEILENAELVEEVVPKRNNNQKQFEKVLYMRYKDVKLTVGVQRTTQEKVQYCITIPQK